MVLIRVLRGIRDGGVVMDRAVFFDVDGVIRHNNTSKEGGCYYCLSPDQVDYIQGIFDAHRFLQSAGYKIFWVTMQNCINEELITEDKVHGIIKVMLDDFKREDIYINDYRVCRSPEENDQSKAMQKAFTIGYLAVDNNIDLSKSIGIGDRKCDILAYETAGIGTTIQALNPFGDKKYKVDYYYSNNTQISNLDTLFNKLMIHHGCNDVTHLIRIAHSFHHVVKVWGDEYWIVNNDDGNYCSKFLVLNPNHTSSLHYHAEKHETFVVLAGIVNIENNGSSRSYIRGESISIESNDEHRFEALLSPAVILETSTFHQDDDTYRLEDSK